MKKVWNFVKSLPWGKALKAAAQIMIPAAVGSGAAVTFLTGCSSMTPSAKTQTMSLYAVGIPGIAVVTQSTQNADNTGDDENRPEQRNPVNVKVPIR